MEIHVRADDTVTLEDAGNFRAFKLVVAHPKSAIERARKALGSVAELPDAETAWVSEKALRAWEGQAGDRDWQDKLGAMIEKAKPYGWIDEAKQAIKAHIDWQD